MKLPLRKLFGDLFPGKHLPEIQDDIEWLVFARRIWAERDTSELRWVVFGVANGEEVVSSVDAAAATTSVHLDERMIEIPLGTYLAVEGAKCRSYNLQLTHGHGGFADIVTLKRNRRLEAVGKTDHPNFYRVNFRLRSEFQ